MTLSAHTTGGAVTMMLPAAPSTLADTGLPESMVADLVLKLLHLGVERTGGDIARHLALPFAVVQPALESLKAMRLCETFGGGLVGGPLFRYRLTDAGRERARQSFAQCQYVGPAPVPLAQYETCLRIAHRRTRPVISAVQVRHAFFDLVLTPELLDQLGVAVTLGHSILLHGSPGNGKSAIARGIRTLLGGDMPIPYAIEVDGQIIRMFDPVHHEPVDDDASASVSAPPRDGRWVRCRRPMVMLGGELTPQLLDLAWSPGTGTYTAPVQLVANGGLLVIDDVGRQMGPLRALLNRWIVPLETGREYLTLATGRTFDVPFTAILVFATNMRPSELGDEAFLRRVRSKILVKSPDAAEFAAIFRQCCEARGLDCDLALVERLLREWLLPRGIELRGCHPRDLIDQALAHAAYRGMPGTLSAEFLEMACATCFPDESGCASS